MLDYQVMLKEVAEELVYGDTGLNDVSSQAELEKGFKSSIAVNILNLVYEQDVGDDLLEAVEALRKADGLTFPKEL